MKYAVWYSDWRPGNWVPFNETKAEMLRFIREALLAHYRSDRHPPTALLRGPHGTLYLRVRRSGGVSVVPWPLARPYALLDAQSLLVGYYFTRDAVVMTPAQVAAGWRVEYISG